MQVRKFTLNPQSTILLVDSAFQRFPSSYPRFPEQGISYIFEGLGKS